MLLSEILNTAKQIKQMNHINESYKSQKISKWFTTLLNSACFIEPHTKYDYYLIQTDKQYFRYTDLINYYSTLLQSGNRNQIQRKCDNPASRDMIMNTKYTVSDKKTEFIHNINIQISQLLNKSFNWSTIKDTDLVQIDIDKARVKPYKNCLQFWTDFDDNLLAICLNNTIILYCDRQYSFDYMEVDDSYTGPTDIDNINSYKEVHDFIEKAFKVKYPRYEIYLNEPNKLKKEKNIANTKQLTNDYNLYKIYALTSYAMENNDMTDTFKAREEYNKFLEEYKNTNIKKIIEYRKIIHNKTSDKYLKKIDNVLDICYNTIIELHKKELEVSNNYISQLNAVRTKYVSLDYLPTEVIKVLKEKEYDSILFLPYRYSSPRKYYKEAGIYIDKIETAFILVLIYIQAIINMCTAIIDFINKKEFKENDWKIIKYNTTTIKNIYTWIIHITKNDILQYCINYINVSCPYIAIKTVMQDLQNIEKD